ncbi:MAG: hypothetical protein AB7P03_11285 [Kofleriaceae bacterium]
MSKDTIKIPRDLRDRMRDVATAHGLGSAQDAANHFVVRGLDRYGTPAGALSERLAHAVDSQGYSSVEELIEHLLQRGLRAYEEPASSPDQLAARLRGLGYIE